MAKKWTVADVCEWLHYEGFGHLRDIFVNNGVDGYCLLGLTRNDLQEELHIKSLQDRKDLWQSLQVLKANNEKRSKSLERPNSSELQQETKAAPRQQAGASQTRRGAEESSVTRSQPVQRSVLRSRTPQSNDTVVARSSALAVPSKSPAGLRTVSFREGSTSKNRSASATHVVSPSASLTNAHDPTPSRRQSSPTSVKTEIPRLSLPGTSGERAGSVQRQSPLASPLMGPTASPRHSVGNPGARPYVGTVTGGQYSAPRSRNVSPRDSTPLSLSAATVVASSPVTRQSWMAETVVAPRAVAPPHDAPARRLSLGQESVGHTPSRRTSGGTPSSVLRDGLRIEPSMLSLHLENLGPSPSASSGMNSYSELEGSSGPGDSDRSTSRLGSEASTVALRRYFGPLDSPNYSSHPSTMFPSVYSEGSIHAAVDDTTRMEDGLQHAIRFDDTSSSAGSVFYDRLYQPAVTVEAFLRNLPEVEYSKAAVDQLLKDFGARIKPKLEQSGTQEAEALALFAYSYEFTGKGKRGGRQIYKSVNQAMRDLNAGALEFWRPFIFFLDNALRRLPAKEMTAFRATWLDLPFGMYDEGGYVVWPAFTAATSAEAVAYSFLKEQQRASASPKGGEGTLFVIACMQGRKVADFSPFPEEGEVLLPPNAMFQVSKVSRSFSRKHSAEITVVNLKQVETPLVLSLILQRMRTLKDNPGAQEKGLGVIASLFQSPSSVMPISEPFLDIILQSMIRFRGQPAVQFAGCQVLAALATDATNCQRIGEHGGVEHVLRVMEPKAKPELLEVALDALGNLLLGEANNERLLQANGVETILAALRQYRATPWLQVAGCRTLSRLVSHASVDMMADVVKADAPLYLLETMRDHKASPAVQQFGAFTLGYLVTYGASKDSVVDGGGLSLVLDAMQRFGQDAGVQEACCFALASMLHNEAMQAKVVRGGGLEAVVGAMRGHPLNAGVQMNGCLALGKLVNGRNPAGLALILRTMEDHPRHEGIQAAGCAAVARLAQDLAARRIIGEGRACALLIDAVRQHKYVAAIQQNGLWVLRQLLGEDPSHRRRFVEAAMPTAVVGTMQRFPGHARIQASGLALLAKVADEPSLASIRLNALALIQTAMREHASDEEVQQQGCLALARFLPDGGQQVNMQEAILSALQVLKQNRDNPKVTADTLDILASLGADPSQCSLLIEHGLVELSLDALRRHPLDAAVVRHACRLVGHLAWDEAASAAYARAGATLLIYRTVQAHRAEVAVQTAGFNAIGVLGLFDLHEPSLRQLDLVDRVLTLLRSHRSDAAIQQAGCQALAGLCSVAAHRRAIVRAGGGPLVVQAMRDFPGDPAVQTACCFAAAGLCPEAEGAASLAKAGVILLLLETLKTSSGHCRLQQAGCEALACLAMDEATAAAVVTGGGIQAILKAMERYPSRVALQAAACVALSKLALSDGHRKRIATAGGIARIVAAMRAHRNSTVVQGGACGALENLAAGEPTRALVMEAGVVDDVLRAMAAHTAEPYVQENACWTLANLAVDASNSMAIVQAGGIQAVIKAMQSHPTFTALQENGCWALENLSSADSNKQAVAAAGGVKVIVDTMGRNVESPSVQERGCRALMSLAMHPTPCNAILELAGLGVVQQAMRRHVRVPDVQRAGCSAILNLTAQASMPNKTKILDSDAVGDVLRAMQTHGDAVGVQERGCFALANFAGLENGREKIMQGGGVDLILQGMRRHPAHAVLQQRGCTVLEILGGVEEHRQAILAAGGLAVVTDALARHPTDPAVQQAAGAAQTCLSSKPRRRDTSKGRDEPKTNGGRSAISTGVSRLARR